MLRNMNRESFNSRILEVDLLDTPGAFKADMIRHLVEQGVEGAEGLTATGFGMSMDRNPIDTSDPATVAEMLGIDLDQLSSGVRAISVSSTEPETERKRVGGRDQLTQLRPYFIERTSIFIKIENVQQKRFEEKY